VFIFNTHFVWAGSVKSVLLQWAGLKGLKIQIADTDIDINSHNYHKINTRNLRLGLVISLNYSEKKTSCYTATYLRCLTCTTKAADEGLGWVCKTTGVLRDGSPPAGSRGRALVGGLGDKVPQKVNNIKSSYKQILRIFW